MKLWKENKVANEYELSETDIADIFWQTEKYRELAEHWPLERCIRAFVTDPKEGLNSVFDEEDFIGMYQAVRESWPKELE